MPKPAASAQAAALTPSDKLTTSAKRASKLLTNAHAARKLSANPPPMSTFLHWRTIVGKLGAAGDMPGIA
jgi:hypothetical protein